MQASKRSIRKNQVVITLEFLDDSGTECLVRQSLTQADLDRHSHFGSVLSSVILQLEHGDPEAFCRILVATFGSGRKRLVDSLGSSINNKILLRFAELIDKAESMNDINDMGNSSKIEEEEEEEEEDNGF